MARDNTKMAGLAGPAPRGQPRVMADVTPFTRDAGTFRTAPGAGQLGAAAASGWAGGMGSSMLGGFTGDPNPRRIGGTASNAASMYASARFRNRIKGLEAQMQDAVDAGDFEAAAAFWDELQRYGGGAPQKFVEGPIRRTWGTRDKYMNLPSSGKRLEGQWGLDPNE